MISSEANGQIKEIVKLQKNARWRRKAGLFVVEGGKMVREAAFYGKLQNIYLSEEAVQESREILEGLEEYPCETVSAPVFRAITDTVTPQGILGLVKMPSYSWEEMRGEEKECFLLLDDLRDPGNLGTIMRTAEGAGMSGVILSKESVDLFNPKVVRATMGAIFRMPFCYVENLADAIGTLKKQGIPVYGTMMQGSSLYDQVDYTGGAGIVIGNEARGISPGVEQCLSAKVRIPMGGKLESLNAAVAAAVLMYEVARQKRQV